MVGTHIFCKVILILHSFLYKIFKNNQHKICQSWANQIIVFLTNFGSLFFLVINLELKSLNPFKNVKNVHETQLGNNILDPKHQFKVLKICLLKVNLVTYFKVTHNLLKRYKNTFWNRTNINVEHSKTMYGFF